MSSNISDDIIIFYADKVYVHHWPLDTPKWTDELKENVNSNLHQNKEKKKIVVKKNQIKINNFEFEIIKKIGITIPLFKKETTMVFEAQFGGFFAHVHITTKEKNYLEIFNHLMSWKDKFFLDS